MSSPPEVLFLDAVGTLFEVAEPVGATYARFAAKHGVNVEAAAMDHAFRCTWKELPAPLHPVGKPPADDDRSWWRELVQQSFEKVLDEPLDPEIFETLFGALYGHFAHARAWHLYDDVVPALEALHGCVRLFVLSNFDGRLRKILQGLGLAPFFERVIVSSEVGAGKPHPRMFEAALQAAGVGPHQCVHAGDEESADVLGPQALGIPALRIARPEVTLLDVVGKVWPEAHSSLRAARK
jgi:putative hydrolase of the HAD superfamily